MKRESSGPYLSAVFVDYDNIYLSLKRRSEDAAKRFAKDAGLWLKEIESGRLITPTNGPITTHPRRMVMNRCYGNPVPRRNSQDNSTDMNSFPFVRHHFLRAGFEIIDCPPLTAQLKNSSDIRMVMDVRDYLTHDTYFDEFIILSGDADFTPVLHRLRAHARRTVIFANDHTAAPYTAISDGEIREADLVTLLVEGRVPNIVTAEPAVAAAAIADQASAAPAKLEDLRTPIIAEVASVVRQSPVPLPLEVLADRAQRTIGHDRTVGSGWAGAGSFRELLAQSLPEDIRLTEQAPFLAYDVKRHAQAMVPPAPPPAPRLEARAQQQRLERAAMPVTEEAIRVNAKSPQTVGQSPLQQGFGQAYAAPAAQAGHAVAPAGRLVPQAAVAAMVPAHHPAAEPTRAAPTPEPEAPRPIATAQPTQLAQPMQPAPPTQQTQLTQPAPPRADNATGIQQSIARIHEACQAPPLAPPEYRVLFELIAQEINSKGLAGAQTLNNITHTAQERGIDARRDDVRFILEVVSEADPWFEQGASANLFAGRFRNFVVARCRGQGLSLSAEELDLIDAWFTGAGNAPLTATVTRPAAEAPAAPVATPPSQYRPVIPAPRQQAMVPPPEPRGERWWSLDDPRLPAAAAPRYPQPSRAPAPAAVVPADQGTGDEFPRIVRTRLRS